MSTSGSPLPEFRKPPVAEVAIGVQFEPLDIPLALLGKYALALQSSGYTKVEQRPPLPPAFERFGRPRGPQRVRLEFGPVVRHWFITEDDNRLVQLQPDRLVQNWRKQRPDDDYPRYDRTIRPEFEQRLGELQEFVHAEGLGELAPNQCEVTYVNHVRPSAVWRSASELSRVLGIAGNRFSDQFLPPPEQTHAAARFVIPGPGGRPAGRLHVSGQSAADADRDEPVFVLTLTARGAPLGEATEGVMRFMDLGREWVVRGFAGITTAEMHSAWERTS